MSDALTAIARDQRRGRCFSQYLEAVCRFLEKPTAANKKATVEAARETDEVRGGYFSGQISLADGIGEILEKLRSGDKQTWAKFLFRLKDSHDLKVLKKLSPFAGQLLVSVDYGCGFVSFYGDWAPFIASIIAKDKGWKVYDADNYVVALPIPDAKKAEVFWIGCGASGPSIPKDHPRSSDAPSLRIHDDDD